MSYINDFISLFTTVYKLLLQIPMLGIGIIIGGAAYRYLLIHYPSLLQKLTAKAEALVSKTETPVTDGQK